MGLTVTAAMRASGSGGGVLRRVVGAACMLVGVCMLACAGWMLWGNRLDEEAALRVTAGVADEVRLAVGEAGDAAGLSAGGAGSLTMPGGQAVSAARTMPTVQIDGYDYIGYLELPTVGLTLPVMDTWDYERLKLAPCRYWGATFSGDLVIAAHNYTSHFGPIASLQLGDPVQLVDADGTAWRYRVTRVEVLDPYDVAGMVGVADGAGGVDDAVAADGAGEAGAAGGAGGADATSAADGVAAVDDGWDLTLFTCTYGGASRVTVRCEQVLAW